MNELAEPFPVSPPAISRHLKVLERAGLIARSREAQWRPSRLQADPLDEAVEWMQSRKRTWEARMDRLDAHLRRKETKMSDPTPAVADQEVRITRIIEARRERVFRAWTDPDEVAAWYGPEHMDAPRERIHIDLRVGGRWELTMVQRGGGAEFAIGYEILELVEPELIVLRSDPMPEVGMHEPVVVRVEFHDHGAKTRITLRDGPYPPPARGHAEAGWSAAFDKLAALVAG